MQRTNSTPPEPTRYRFQFTLRSLLLMILLASLALSWLSPKLERVRRRREFVERVSKLGGSVYYAHKFDPYFRRSKFSDPPGPEWLRRIFGDDLLAPVESVDLRGVAITENDLVALSQFRHLRNLILRNTGILDDDLRHLQQLPKLLCLDLSGTDISDAGLESVAKIDSLVMLMLAGTRVSYDGMVHLARLKRLRYVNIERTAISADEVQALQRALPYCQIGTADADFRPFSIHVTP